MSSEFESKVLEKLETLDRKIDRLDVSLNKKIDGVYESLNNKIDAVNENLNNKIDAVNENLNKKIDYIDNKHTERSESLSDKIDYLTNNVAIILQEQIKMREEMQKYNEQNEKEHRLFEYEINNLKRLVV